MRSKYVRARLEKSRAQKVMLINVRLKNIRARLRNMRERLENMKAKLKNVRARRGNVSLKCAKARFGNVKARLRNIKPQKFFSEADKARHLQLNLPRPDGNITEHQQFCHSGLSR